jgi:hypothetical protein
MEILTQQELQIRLRAEGLPLGTPSIHACIEAGMPVVRIPGHKKPRFHWPSCWAWLIASRELDPLALATRDRLFHRNSRRTTA